MDDAIIKPDGFRFSYSLPFAPRRLLGRRHPFFRFQPTSSRKNVWLNVTDYLSNIGINDWTIVRETNGVLPDALFRSRNAPSEAVTERFSRAGIAGG